MVATDKATVVSLWPVIDRVSLLGAVSGGQIEVRVARASDRVMDLVSDADVVVADPSGHHVIDKEVAGRMGRCRLIQQPAVGLDGIDVAAVRAHGIPLANVVGTNAAAVGDWVVMAVIVLVRSAIDAHVGMQVGRWTVPEPGRELGSLTVGLIGMGSTARAVTKRLSGFGCRVMFSNYRRVIDPPPSTEQVELDELLEVSDVVSLHVPLTDRTRSIIGESELRRMKKDAVLVNAGRGELVDEEALAHWLAESPDRRAALDVFSVEPLPAGSPFRHSPQVLLSPHVAALTREARARLREAVVGNIRRVLDDLPPENLVGGEDQ